MEDCDSDQLLTIIVVDAAAFYFAVARVLRFSEADIEDAGSLIVIKPEMTGLEIQSRRYQTQDVDDFCHWRPFFVTFSALDVMNAVTMNPSAWPSRYTTTTCFRPSGGCGKASRLDVFPLDEIPKDLELRIAGEQRGVRGYGERCGETIGIGHGIPGF